jgi:uncharacterized protein (DUF1330 family)
MVAYLIGELDVTDAQGYGDYAKDSPKAVLKFGGRYIARGGRTTTLEGEDPPSRVVIVEFPSMENATAFYNSKEYQTIVPLRKAAAAGRLFVVEGVA